MTSTRPSEKHHNVYAIELDKEVLQHRKFREENPDYIEGKPCVYVGRTGKTPDERFQQHKAGIRDGKYVKRYGRYLRRKLYEKYNPMTFDEACKREEDLAEELRNRGYAVHQR